MTAEKPKTRVRRRIGPVEAATRKYILSQGELSPRQAVTAAGLVAMAKRADSETRSGPLATLHRELRVALAGLRDTSGAFTAPVASPSGAGRPPRGSLDQLADKRVERQQKEAALLDGEPS